jgi:hypothetical protein
MRNRIQELSLMSPQGVNSGTANKDASGRLPI